VIAVIITAVIVRQIYEVPEWHPGSDTAAARSSEKMSDGPSVSFWWMVPKGSTVREEKELVLYWADGKLKWQGIEIKDAEVSSYVSGLLGSQKKTQIVAIFNFDAKMGDMIAVVDRLRLTTAKGITISYQQ